MPKVIEGNQQRLKHLQENLTAARCTAFMPEGWGKSGRMKCLWHYHLWSLLLGYWCLHTIRRTELQGVKFTLIKCVLNLWYTRAGQKGIGDTQSLSNPMIGEYTKRHSLKNSQRWLAHVECYWKGPTEVETFLEKILQRQDTQSSRLKG